MARQGTLTVRIIGDPDNLARAMRGLERDADRFAGRVLGSMAAVGAGVVAGATAGVVAFANFDQAMTNSLAIMGDVSDDMRDQMARVARDIGTSTTHSATEAAEAFYFLASAGMDAEQAMAALPIVAQFAQAGNFDMARATDLATDAQSALGLTSADTAENIENLSRVMDVLVASETLANASTEQFAEALTNRAGAAMSDLSIEMEQGLAVLAAFAEQGVKGAAAGTMFNSTMHGLTNTAMNNAEAYEELGVAVYDSQGELRNMADIIGDLETALDGMSTEQRIAALSSLGLTRQSRDGVVALLGSSEAIREYESELRGAAGTSAEVADNQLQTFWAQLGLLKDQLIEVGISVGERLMPHLMTLIDKIDENADAISDFVLGAVDAMVDMFVNYVVPAVEKVVEWLGKLVDWWNNLSDPMQTVIKAFAIAIAAIIPIVAIIIKLIAAVKALGVVLAVVTSPIGLVVAAVALLAAGVYLLIKHWDTVAGWFSDLWDKVVEIFDKAVQWVVDLIEGLVDTVLDWFWSLTYRLAEIVADIINNVMDAFRDMRDAVVRFARELWEGALEQFREMLAFVRSIPGRITSALRGMGSLLLDAGRDLIEGFLRGIRQVVDAPVQAIRDMVARIRNLLPFSPAKDGPLSGRGYSLFSGETLAEDFGAGIADGARRAVKAAEAMTADVSAATMPPGAFGSDGTMMPAASQTTVNVTVTSADPEAVVEAIRRYVRVNGTVPGVSVRAGL